MGPQVGKMATWPYLLGVLDARYGEKIRSGLHADKDGFVTSAFSGVPSAQNQGRKSEVAT